MTNRYSELLMEHAALAAGRKAANGAIIVGESNYAMIEAVASAKFDETLASLRATRIKMLADVDADREQAREGFARPMVTTGHSKRPEVDRRSKNNED